MATVRVYTADRMQEIEDNTIVNAEIIAGNLILYRHNGTTVNAGPVTGGGSAISGAKHVLAADYQAHDLSPDAGELMSGTFTPDSTDVKLLIEACFAGWGAARFGLFMYIGQPATPGQRLYNAGGVEIAPATLHQVGSIPPDTGFGVSTSRSIELSGIDLSKQITYQIMGAVIGAAQRIPVGDFPAGAGITPNCTKIFVCNYNAATVTPIKLSRPGFSMWSPRIWAEDVAETAVAVGTAPRRAACGNTRTVITNFLGHTCTILNSVTNAVVSTPDLGAGNLPMGVAIDPTETYAYVGCGNGKVFRITIATAVVSAPLTLGAGADYLDGCAVSADGTTLWVINTTADVVYKIALPGFASAAATISTGAGSDPVAINIATDGMVWVLTYSTGRIKCINPATNTIVQDYDLPFNNPLSFTILKPVPGDIPRTSMVAYQGNNWSQFYIGGDFAGQAHPVHQGSLGGGGDPQAVLSNDFGEPWIVLPSTDEVLKLPGGRITCLPVSGGVFQGHYLEVSAFGAH